MKNHFKRIAVLIIFTLVTPFFLSFFPFASTFSSNEAKAAEIGPTVVPTSVTVGVNSPPETIQINNYNPLASYAYQIKDSSIAKRGDIHYSFSTYSSDVTGVAKGKTKIIVTETINGVTNKIGEISVKVVGAELEKKMDVGLNGSSVVPIKYGNLLATNKYKSADEKIATVDSDGQVTGKKVGKTTISVTQMVGKTTIKLGSITVNVIKATLQDKKLDTGIDEEEVYIKIANQNYKAVYAYTSLDKKIVTADDSGRITGIKYGTAKVKVTETYQKKVRTVGTLTINVVKATLNSKSKTIYLGIGTKCKLKVSGIVIDHQVDFDAKYTCEAADSSTVECSYEVDEYGFIFSAYIYGASLGKTEMTIYEEYNGKKRSLGTVVVSVIEIPITDLVLYFGEGESGELPTCNYYTWQETLQATDYYETVPNNTTTPVMYRSSDESVITIDNDGNMNILAEGNSTITITCGNFTVAYIAVVKENE